MTQTRDRNGPFRYRMIELGRVPRNMGPQARQWAEIIQRCIETGESAVIEDLKGLTRRRVTGSLSDFVSRYPDLVVGVRVRTRIGTNSEVYVWCEKKTDSPGRRG